MTKNKIILFFYPSFLIYPILFTLFLFANYSYIQGIEQMLTFRRRYLLTEATKGNYVLDETDNSPEQSASPVALLPVQAGRCTRTYYRILSCTMRVDSKPPALLSSIPNLPSHFQDKYLCILLYQNSFYMSYLHSRWLCHPLELNSLAWVRKRTIPSPSPAKSLPTFSLRGATWSAWRIPAAVLWAF
jgi:hypothetical protein